MLGAIGKPEGVTELLDDDTGPVPIAFVAVIVKVYAVPFVSPCTIPLAVPVDVIAEVKSVTIPPGDDKAVNFVIRDPPLFGAVNDIVHLESLATATKFVGAPGTLVDVIELDENDELDPTLLVRIALKVYVVPVVKPVIVKV